MIEVVPLGQGSSEWLQSRFSYIGASDVAAIFNKSPWSTREKLLVEKKGKILGEQKEVFKIGHQKEVDARQLLEAKMGFPLPSLVLRNPDFPFAQVSTDGFNVENQFLIEVKYLPRADFLLIDKNIVPEKYIYQLQYQMLICELDQVLFVGTAMEKLKSESEPNPLFCGIKSCWVGADFEMQKNIIEECKKFWGEMSCEKN